MSSPPLTSFSVYSDTWIRNGTCISLRAAQRSTGMRSLARICPMYRGLRLPSEMSGVEERLSLAVGCVSTVPTFHLGLAVFLRAAALSCVCILLFFAHVCMCLFVLCRGTAVLFSLQSLVQTSIFDTAASDLVLFVEDASYVLQALSLLS